jgi:hypothetical protein
MEQGTLSTQEFDYLLYKDIHTLTPLHIQTHKLNKKNKFLITKPIQTMFKILPLIL